jgi:UbiD family decarboxylase
MLQAGGPALLFENVKDSAFPIAVNLMETIK